MFESLRLRRVAVAMLLSGTAFAQPADLVLHSNHVVTMDDAIVGDTVAVRGARIVFVGARSDARSLIGDGTEVLELADAAVLPGLIDAHGHVSFAALTGRLANVASPPVGPVRTVRDLVATLKAHIRDRGLGEQDWVVGMGYDDSLLAEGRHPNRDDLDTVSSTQPVALLHVSGHLVAANSKALALAGITVETPDPPGGLIRRYPGTSEPNGVLEEAASFSVREFMLAPGEDPAADFRAALSRYASYGITTVQDGAASPEIVDFIADLDRSGELQLDVVAYPLVLEDPGDWLDRYAYGGYQDRFKVGGVKLMLDGSPQGRTAYMTQPYKVPPHGQDRDYRGYPTLPQHVVDDLVTTFVGAGIPVIAHANGDAAADMLIRAVSESDYERDHRTVMIHAQTVREDQLDAMGRLGIIPSYFSAHSFFWGDWHRDTVFGEERAARISPTASTLARELIFTVHNDAPVVPPDMARLLWATTNRVTRSGKVLGEAQRIAAYPALKAVTTFAAHQYFEEHRKGSITPGKLADLVVVSRNPLEHPEDELLELRVLRTYSHGVLVYAAPGVGP